MPKPKPTLTLTLLKSGATDAVLKAMNVDIRRLRDQPTIGNSEFLAATNVSIGNQKTSLFILLENDEKRLEWERHFASIKVAAVHGECTADLDENGKTVLRIANAIKGDLKVAAAAANLALKGKYVVETPQSKAKPPVASDPRHRLVPRAMQAKLREQERQKQHAVALEAWRPIPGHFAKIREAFASGPWIHEELGKQLQVLARNLRVALPAPGVNLKQFLNDLDSSAATYTKRGKAELDVRQSVTLIRVALSNIAEELTIPYTPPTLDETAAPSAAEQARQKQQAAAKTSINRLRALLETLEKRDGRPDPTRNATLTSLKKEATDLDYAISNWAGSRVLQEFLAETDRLGANNFVDVDTRGDSAFTYNDAPDYFRRQKLRLREAWNLIP